eukprot:1148534-Pyramimonas_sp.AAC.1
MAARSRASAARRRHPRVSVDHPPARVGRVSEHAVVACRIHTAVRSIPARLGSSSILLRPRRCRQVHHPAAEDEQGVDRGERRGGEGGGDRGGRGHPGGVHRLGGAQRAVRHGRRLRPRHGGLQGNEARPAARGGCAPQERGRVRGAELLRRQRPRPRRGGGLRGDEARLAARGGERASWCRNEAALLMRWLL